MPEAPTSRRDFLLSSGALMGGAWLAASLPAIREAAAHARRAALSGQTAFQVLSAAEARDLEAMAAQIIPADDTPGAREAGVIHFIDQALETFARGMQEGIREGIADLARRARERSPDAGAFADLPDAEQTALLREIENTPFFGGTRFLTVAGMFADPSYGGNKDQAGWNLLGFDGQFAHQPPFGYYDREYGEGRE